MQTAKQTLDAASSAVCGARNEDYGSPANDFATQAEMFSSYLSRTNGAQVLVTASDIAALMILVKIARQAHCHKADNWIDVAGYAACGAECDARQADLA
jgi:hypothetical protein